MLREVLEQAQRREAAAVYRGRRREARPDRAQATSAGSGGRVPGACPHARFTKLKFGGRIYRTIVRTMRNRALPCIMRA